MDVRAPPPGHGIKSSVCSFASKNRETGVSVPISYRERRRRNSVSIFAARCGLYHRRRRRRERSGRESAWIGGVLLIYFTSATGHKHLHSTAVMTGKKIGERKRKGSVAIINTHVVFGHRPGGCRIGKTKCLCHMRSVGHEWRGPCSCAPSAASGVPDGEADQ